MPPVGFEPTVSASDRPQTYALDRAGTGTGQGSQYEAVRIRHLPIKTDNVTGVDLYDTRLMWTMNLCGPEQNPQAGSCGHSNEFFSSTKGGGSAERLRF